VPHRVVCLLGLDDAVFPRRAPRDGDDLALDDPHVGDRDPRAEDRQMLLDALMAATDRLVAFAERPVRAFLRLRLGIGAGRADEEVDDGLPVELGGLESWAVGQRLLDAVLAGTELEAAIAAERARGTLPPGRLADPVIGRVRPLVEAIAARALRSWPAGAPESVDVRVALETGRVLSGTVAGVRGDGVGTVTFSRVSARHRLAAWVRLLALTAARPERPFSAATVGRARVGVQAQVTAARLAPLGADAAARSQAALAHLATLVDLYDRGMREPLPIACLASAAYAQAARSGASAEAAGRREWESGWNREREDAEPEHELVLGGRRSFAELLAAPPRADEAGPGWEEGDPSRFGRHARRLWAGVLDHETLEEG
jgi:exodeoxyribonuclease V gamma subunit